MSPHPLHDICHREVEALVRQVVGIESAAVVTGDGFEVASELRDGVSPEKLAAMVSSLLALSEAVAGELGMQQCRYVIVDTTAGSLVTLRIPVRSQQLLMSVLCSDQASLGTVLFASRDAARALGDRLHGL